MLSIPVNLFLVIMILVVGANILVCGLLRLQGQDLIKNSPLILYVTE